MQHKATDRQDHRFDGSILYHYTDSYALRQLMRPDRPSIWASEAYFLNDAAELEMGRESLIKELKHQAISISAAIPEIDSEKYSTRGILEQTRASVMSYVAAELEVPLAESSNRDRVFVACFCEHGDLLSQWRSYGHGGYSIGFRRVSMDNLRPVDFRLTDEIVGVNKYFAGEMEARLAPVDYVSRVSLKVIRDLIDDAIDKRPPPSTGFAYLRGTWETLYRLAGLKNDAFVEEREVRSTFILRSASNHDQDDGTGSAKRVVASEVRPPVHFRDTPGGIVPYVRLEFPPNAITEVIVGPGGNQGQKMMGLRRLLHEIDREDIAVTASSIPYRG